jgi:hypothetical protein
VAASTAVNILREMLICLLQLVWKPPLRGGLAPAHDDDRDAVVQWSKRRRGADPLERGSILIPAIR